MIEVKLDFPPVSPQTTSNLMKFRDHMREQAARNALTLTFMAIGFVLTWIFIFVATVWGIAHV